MRYSCLPILAFVLLSAPAAPAAGAPNIVFILLDDVGYDDFGFTGSPLVQTPHFDALVAEGVLFTQYYANSSVCSPTRAALLTGRYPTATRMRANVAGSQRGLPPDLATLPQVLKQAGYLTAHFGKWHVGRSRPEMLPEARGFDHSVIRAYGEFGSYWDQTFRIDGQTEVQIPGNATEALTDQVIGFLQQHSSERFFVNLWYNAAHQPYEPPQRWAEQYPPTPQGRYAAHVSHADEQVGRILDSLRDLGLEESTLVVVTSDNGANGVHGKTKLYEPGIRVPAIARWEGATTAGATNESVFVSFDWLPTLAVLAGAGTAGLALDGRDRSAALVGGSTLAREETLFWERPGDYTAFESPTGEFDRFAVRIGDWKLLREVKNGAGTLALYDLAIDPEEGEDVAGQQPALVQDLLLQYHAWRRRVARIDAKVESLQGAAAVAATGFDFAGGVAVLAPDDRFAFHDADFSLQARVVPSEAPGATQVIAEHPDSWVLRLRDDGRAEVVVQGEAAATQTTLVSASPLAAGIATELAFTVYGWRDSPSNVRLYVDGQLQAETQEIDAVNPSLASVRVGAAADGSAPFFGAIRGLEFGLLALTADEVSDADRDGIPDPLDNCSADPNPRQIDTDADGYGNACDADYDGNGLVTSRDFAVLRAALFSVAGDPAYRAEVDFDSNASIDGLDFGFLRTRLWGPPGPSGLACAGNAPCPAP